MLHAGIAVPIVAERLPPARYSTTLNRYAHAVPGGDRAAAQILGNTSATGMTTISTGHETGPTLRRAEALAPAQAARVPSSSIQVRQFFE